ncbi:putative reverse transcriptase domain-containing protein [Tanacetum coccineum]
MEEINFQQEPDETLYQAWERFKELLIKCPQHYLTEMQEVILFYNGLDIPTRHILDSRAIQAQLNNIGREIKKVNEKVYAAQVGCKQCKGPHYTKDCPLKEEGKTLEEAYYMQFGRPFQCGVYRATALGFYQRNNANPSYQERRQSMKDTLSKFMSESTKRHEENSNLIKEIQASTDAAIRASVSVMPFSTYLNLGLGKLAHTKLTEELADRTMKYPKGVAENMLVDYFKGQGRKDVFTSVKRASGLIKRVYMLSLRERMELDLEARLIGETLVLNFEDYIELNDLNEPFELRRNQGDDLIPTIEEGEVIEENRTRDDELDARIDDYPSYCDYDKKVHIDLITEYLVNISKRRAFWSLNEDILKINDSDYQYAVSIKEDTTYLCLHSPKTTKETTSIRRIGNIVCEDSGRYQTWSIL